MRPSPVGCWPKRRHALGLATLLLLAWLPTEAEAARGPRPVRIAIVADGPSPQNEPIQALFQKEIRAVTEGDYLVSFSEPRIGDWTASGATRVVDAALADPEVDLVLTLGILVGNDAGRRDGLPKPVVAPFVIDAALQGFTIQKDGRSAKRNFSFLQWSWSPARDLATVRRLVDFDHLVVLANADFVKAVPGLAASLTMAMAKEAARMTLVSVPQEAGHALRHLPEDADAVYVGPMLHLSDEQFDVLAKGLIAARLPSFSLLGRDDVERGVMAGTAPASDYPRLARKVSLLVQRLLDGEPAGVLDTVFEQGSQLVINMATARAIRYFPTWDSMTEAVLLNSEIRAPDRKLDLPKAVREALEANADLLVADQAIAVGAEEVRKTLGPLLPHAEVNVAGRLIDSDRARASNGSNPQVAATVGASITQLIYSDKAWANREVAEILQDRRVVERRSVELDVSMEAGQAYIDVLRAHTLHRIRKQDLSRTREHLELARRRQKLGASGASDVYRWENELANDRSEVIAASTQVEIARMNLNRLMGRPLEERFDPHETTLADPYLITSHPRIFGMLDNPWSFAVFRDFMVGEGLRESPELEQLDLALAAQDRATTLATRSLWVPDVALQFSFSHAFLTEGAGKDTEPITIPNLGEIPLPEADKTNFTLGLQLTLPLFEGMERFAEIDRSRAETVRLERVREAAAEKIEQRVRTAVFLAGASHPAIRLSRDAATAARKNLDLVTDAYSRGAVSIPVLLDAQNAARIADELAANAVYDFLRDLMGVHRAVGRFYFLQPEAYKRDWLARLEQHFRAARAAEEGRR